MNWLFEGWAAGDAIEGNTISENAWMWLCYHILLETPGRPGV